MLNIPAGWKLVPERATKAMQDAWDSAPFNEDTDIEFHGAYAAMLSAAPASAQEAVPDARNRVMEVIAGVWDHATQIDDAADEVIEMLSPAPAAGDALDAAAPEWMTCDKRGWMVRESLTRNAKQMRTDEKRCRNAYNEEYMGAPTCYLADVFAEAAAVFEAKLAAIAAQVPQQGEA